MYPSAIPFVLVHLACFAAFWTGITWTAVAPGHVDTEWTRAWPAERKAAAIERTLLRRHCTAADIAGAIVFLCADNSMITAQTLVVDGGYSL